MFGKKKCKRCGKIISDKDSFCANCGLSMNNLEKEEDWGMLGKNDMLSPEIGIPGFNMLFNSIMRDFGGQFKTIEKELKNSFEKDSKPMKKGISISISTSGNSPPKIKINNLNGEPIRQMSKEAPPRKKEKILSVLSEEKTREFLSLPKKNR